MRQVFNWNLKISQIIVLSLKYYTSVSKKCNLLPKLIWQDEFPPLYQENQESIRENDILANHEFSIEALTNIIKKSIPNTALKSHFYEPKNKWFNTDCFNARNKSLKWLRKFQKSSDILEKEKYINATKKYKAV